MQKKSYRAVAVKKVHVEQLRQAVGGGRVVVGIDAAKTDFVAALASGSGEHLLTVKWRNPVETREFVALFGGLGASRVEAAMESTGSYGTPVLHVLREAGVAVFRARAKHVHDVSEMFDGVPSSHDAKAASIIAKLHLDKRSQPWTERAATRRDLAAATKSYDRLRDVRVRYLNELEAELAWSWPELLTQGKTNDAYVVALLESYGSPAKVAADPQGARALMVKTGGHLLKSEKVDAVLESAKTSIGMPMTDGELKAIQGLAQLIRQSGEQSRTLKAEVAALVSADEAGARLAEVIGPLAAASLLSTVGDPGSYPRPATLVKALGLNLKEHSSGKKKGQLAITKRGPGDTRQLLCLATWRLVQRDPVVGAWYQAKVARDGGKVKMKGVVAVMRKVTKALWHVARGSTFDATKLFDVRRLELATKAA